MMYIPKIINYKPFYIQTASDEVAIDTRSWGLIVKSNPHFVLPKAKTIYKNDWKDENGDDEYIGELKFEAFSIDITFYAKAFSLSCEPAVAILERQIVSFFKKISQGEFKIYDSHTGQGFQKVRYDSFDDQSIEYKVKDNWARVIFSIKLKINDPVTRIHIWSDGILK